MIEETLEFAEGYAAGVSDTLDQSDITPTFDDGYQQAVADIHAALTIEAENSPDIDWEAGVNACLEIIEEEFLN